MNRLLLTAALLGAATCAASAQSSIVDTAKQAGTFTTLLTAVEKAGLAKTLLGKGPFTVLAPTDAAFAKLPKGTLDSLLTPEGLPKLRAILSHHVLTGRTLSGQALQAEQITPLSGQPLRLKFTDGALQVGNAKLVTVDLACSNGVIHVIDTVLLPNLDDVVETASKAGAFKTLLAAAKAAGLVDTLKGEGPLTVFAPTDAAFAKLPKGTVASLLEPKNKAQLVAILSAHVLSGRVDAAAALRAGKAPSLEGTEWPISIDEGVLRVGGSQIVQADIQASNGVIHVIDQVLLPAKPEVAAPSCGQLIERSIQRGSKLFNAHRPKACVAVYQTCAEALLMQTIPDAARDTLAVALLQVEREKGSKRQAWILRDALDSVYSRMSSAPASTCPTR